MIHPHKHRWVVWKEDVVSPNFPLDAPPDLIEEMSKNMFTYRWCTVPGCYMVQKCRVKSRKKYDMVDERLMMCDHNIETHDRFYPVKAA